MAKKTGGKYPTKTTMNLFFREDKTSHPSTMALYILFGAVVFLALAKVGVYDMLVDLDKAQKDLQNAQERLMSISQQLTDYNEVQDKYNRYSYGYLTDEERALVDRMDILTLLESELMYVANVENITIGSNAVAARISGVTLEEVSKIAQRLEASELVTAVSVSTAVTSDPNTGADILTANMIISVANTNSEGGQKS